MNELGIQTELVRAAQALGGHAFKATNRFKKGILDLSVQLPGMRHVYIEVKFARRFAAAWSVKRPDLHHEDHTALHQQYRGAVRLTLTPHQRRFIVQHREAGGCTGWLMVVGEGRQGRYAMDCSALIPSHGVLYWRPGDNQWLVKEHGGTWPIVEVVKRLQR